MKVRDVVKTRTNGWKLVRTKGSHRQFHHIEKPGTVTVAGHPSVDISPRNVKQYPQAGRSQVKYLVVYEKSPLDGGPTRLIFLDSEQPPRLSMKLKI